MWIGYGVLAWRRSARNVSADSVLQFSRATAQILAGTSFVAARASCVSDAINYNRIESALAIVGFVSTSKVAGG